MVEGSHCRCLGLLRTSFWVRHRHCENFAALGFYPLNSSSTPTPPTPYTIRTTKKISRHRPLFSGGWKCPLAEDDLSEEPAPRLPDSRRSGGWRAAPAARERMSPCSCAFSGITLAGVPLARADLMVKPRARLSRGCTRAWERRHTGLERSR